MAAHDIWQTTQLVPLLREPGVELSATQVYRLVTDKPERLSLRTLTPALRHPRLQPGGSHRALRRGGRPKAESRGATVIDVSPNLRPKRARILDDGRQVRAGQRKPRVRAGQREPRVRAAADPARHIACTPVRWLLPHVRSLARGTHL
jgi:hypothetical protein